MVKSEQPLYSLIWEKCGKIDRQYMCQMKESFTYARPSHPHVTVTHDVYLVCLVIDSSDFDIHSDSRYHQIPNLSIYKLSTILQDLSHPILS